MSHYVFDKTYLADEAAGIPAHRVVVAGSSANTASLAAASNASGILGVSLEAQDENGAPVAVRKLGVALVEASEAVAAGEFLLVAGSTGRVMAVPAAAGPTNVVGIAETASSGAGDLIEVFLNIHLGSS